MSDWLEIRVRSESAQSADVDDLAGRVATEVGEASAGVEIRGDLVVFWVKPEDAETAAAAAAALGPVEIATAIPEAEWRDAYKRYFKPTRLTRQLVVVPSWERYRPEPGDLEIHIDPGQAFGTGSHATTRLVLAALQAAADAGDQPARILDFGTGSGILSIAAALLFPGAELAAIDNDPLAVDAAVENLARNGVGDRVAALCCDDPAALSIEPDLVLANIQRGVLVPAAPALTRLAAASATLLLSGLLAEQLDEVSGAYQVRGWREARRALDGEDASWGLLVMER
jgi:ribosomal protein L11 methyltransferase